MQFTKTLTKFDAFALLNHPEKEYSCVTAYNLEGIINNESDVTLTLIVNS